MAVKQIPQSRSRRQARRNKTSSSRQRQKKRTTQQNSHSHFAPMRINRATRVRLCGSLHTEEKSRNYTTIPHWRRLHKSTTMYDYVYNILGVLGCRTASTMRWDTKKISVYTLVFVWHAIVQGIFRTCYTQTLCIYTKTALTRSA